MLFVYVVVCPYYPMPQWDQLKWLARVGPIPVLGLFYFTVGMSIRLGILNGIVERVGNISPIVWMVLGIFFVIARAIAVDIGFGLLGAYCGFVSIPFLILFFWGVIPCVKGPDWLVFSSFPVFVIHKFFYLAVNNFVEKNTIYVYVLCFLSVFVLSLLMTNIIRCVSPKICAFVFGGR